MKSKVLCFDLDGTLCTNTEGAYESATPYPKRISVVNSFYRRGATIIICTARGTMTGIDWGKTTRRQLKKWRVRYHTLQFGKPAADIYIDDKATNAAIWFRRIGLTKERPS